MPFKRLLKRNSGARCIIFCCVCSIFCYASQKLPRVAKNCYTGQSRDIHLGRVFVQESRQHADRKEDHPIIQDGEGELRVGLRNPHRRCGDDFCSSRVRHHNFSSTIFSPSHTLVLGSTNCSTKYSCFFWAGSQYLCTHLTTFAVLKCVHKY